MDWQTSKFSFCFKNLKKKLYLLFLWSPNVPERCKHLNRYFTNGNLLPLWVLFIYFERSKNTNRKHTIFKNYTGKKSNKQISKCFINISKNIKESTTFFWHFQSKTILNNGFNSLIFWIQTDGWAWTWTASGQTLRVKIRLKNDEIQNITCWLCHF